MNGLGRVLVFAGLAVAALGLLLSLSPRLPLGWVGKLPGDFRVERGNFRFYFPLATSLLFSIVVTLALRLFSRR